ncbi:hypothetical protein EG328_003244, partial [Venturia inaequalis]
MAQEAPPPAPSSRAVGCVGDLHAPAAGFYSEVMMGSGDRCEEFQARGIQHLPRNGVTHRAYIACVYRSTEYY